MADFSIRFDADKVKQMLAQAPGEVRGGLREGLTKLGDSLLPEAQQYPPARGNYARTFRLRRSWSTAIKERADGPQVTLVSDDNIAPYNRNVQDEDYQSPAHRGRWRNTVQTLRRQAGSSRAVEDRITTRLRILE